ncbi:MAG: phage tail protein [Deltaproteobacteria bacterium]|nr:phage tail protein [Deltaproteobacteria bacterium]
MNLVSMFQKVHESAANSDAKMFGVEIGIVTDTKDPDKGGRVKLKFPRLNADSDWVRVVQPAAGAGRGFYWIPEVNDEVLVVFERGEAHRPFVIGALWNGKDKPMKDAYQDDNSTRMIQTKSGHQIILADKKDEEKIIIADKSGKRTVTWDVKAKKFLIEAKEGDVYIMAEKKIVLSCEDLEIKTKKTGKIDIGDTFDLVVKADAGIKTSATMNVKGKRVNIN